MVGQIDSGWAREGLTQGSAASGTKWLAMTQRPPKPVVQRSSSRKATALKSGGAQTDDEAFDLWLKRGLHQIYDDVAREPIPDELLKLIQQDKQK